MTKLSLLFIAYLSLFFSAQTCFSSTPDLQAMSYFQQYGYISPGASVRKISKSDYQNAIEIFQRFNGLNVSGTLDDATVKKMKSPRCGVKDIFNNGEKGKRRKRFAVHYSKWPKQHLTYRITKYSVHLRKANIDREVARAFKVWSDVTPLTFNQTKNENADIEIKFVNGEHGDFYPFDGPGGTLAHAFYPLNGGDAHVDDTEEWTISGYSGTNLFQVLAHEFGHSLGLEHSSEPEAIMAPIYPGYNPDMKLHEDDILGIQSLYGKKI